MITKLLGTVPAGEDLTSHPRGDNPNCHPAPFDVVPKAPLVAKMKTLFLLSIQCPAALYLVHSISTVAMAAAAATNTQLSTHDSLP